MVKATNIEVGLTLDDQATGALKKFEKELGDTGREGKKAFDKVSKEATQAGKDIDRMGSRARGAGRRFVGLGRDGKTAMDKVDRSTKKASVSVGKLAVGLGAAFAAFKAFQVAGRVGLGFVRDAAKFEEDVAKFEVVFGEESLRVAKQLDTLSGSVKRSKSELIDFASGFQDIFVPLGFARADAADLSVQLTKLAIDVGSFNNKMDADVIIDFKSALVGNSETVRKYGILIDEVRIKQTAYALGITKAGEKVTAQEKVIARYNILMADTSDALGDAERTSGSFSNTMKGLQAVAKDLGVVFGQELQGTILGVIDDLGGLEGVADLIKVAFAGVTTATEFMIERIGGAAETVKFFIDSIGGADRAVAILRGEFEASDKALGHFGDALAAVPPLAFEMLKVVVVIFREMGRQAGQAFTESIGAESRKTLSTMKLFWDKASLDGFDWSGVALGLADLEVRPEVTISESSKAEIDRQITVALLAFQDIINKIREGVKEATGDDLLVRKLNIADFISAHDSGAALERGVATLIGLMATELDANFGLIDNVAAQRFRGILGNLLVEAATTGEQLPDELLGNLLSAVDAIGLGSEFHDALLALKQVASEVDVPPFEGLDEAQKRIDKLRKSLGMEDNASAVRAAAEAAIALASANVGQSEEAQRLLREEIDLIYMKRDAILGAIAAKEREANVQEVFTRLLGDEELGLKLRNGLASSFERAIGGVAQSFTDAEFSWGAFRDQFLMGVAQMITQALLLASIKSLLGTTALGTFLFPGNAMGGVVEGVGSMATGDAPGYAMGGILSGVGAMQSTLPIQQYATGGIARTPQLAVFGEGRGAEAFVPLPDGKSIPVTMSGGDRAINVNLTVSSLDPRTAADVVLAQMPAIRKELSAALREGTDRNLIEGVRGAARR